MVLPTVEDVKGMKVVELKAELAKHDLPTTGLKAELQKRLLEYIENAGEGGEGGDGGSSGAGGNEVEETVAGAVTLKLKEEKEREKEQEEVSTESSGRSQRGRSPSKKAGHVQAPSPGRKAKKEEAETEGEGEAETKGRKEDKEAFIAPASEPAPPALAAPALAAAPPVKPTITPSAVPLPSSSSPSPVAVPLALTPVPAMSTAPKPQTSSRVFEAAMAATAAPAAAASATAAVLTGKVTAAPTPAPTMTESKPPSVPLAEPTVEADTEAAALAVPDPKNPRSATLRVDGFIRPFRLTGVKDLLEEKGGGPLVGEHGLWMDAIKTHCYATFESEDSAARARVALYNLTWPERGGVLRADFAPITALQAFEDEKAAKAAKVARKSLPPMPTPAAVVLGAAVASPAAATTAAEAAAKLKVSNTLLRNAVSVEMGVAVTPGLIMHPSELRETTGGGMKVQGGGDTSGKRADSFEMATGAARRKRELGPSPDRNIKAKGEREGDGGAEGGKGKEKEKKKMAMPTLEELFRFTTTQPKLYWLPLPEDEVALKRQRRKELKAAEKARGRERDAMQKEGAIQRVADSGARGGGGATRREWGWRGMEEQIAGPFAFAASETMVRV